MDDGIGMMEDGCLPARLAAKPRAVTGWNIVDIKGTDRNLK